MKRPEWHQRAACRFADQALFFGPDGERDGPAKARRDKRAKAICAGCPVRAECLEAALDRPERSGTWGGLTEAELKREQRRRQFVAKYSQQGPAALCASPCGGRDLQDSAVGQDASASVSAAFLAVARLSSRIRPAT